MVSKAIVIENLTKRFNGFVAVNRISFEVYEGEIFGLLGPNGAGKTTTVRMLSTILMPSEGRATIAGYDVVKEKENVRRSIGIVFQEPSLDTKLTGRENLEFHAMMYGMKKGERKKRIQEVLNLVGLENFADVLVEKYSGGMKRRLEIARGLIHRPKVLFLDEPTLGLDAHTRRKIWEYVKLLNAEHKTTIILTTHYMEEADYLCDRVAIINEGRIIALNTPKALKDIIGGDVVSVEVAGDVDKFKRKMERFRWVKLIESHGNTLNLTMEMAEKRIPKIFEIASNLGIKINSVSLRKPSLEDVFMHFTGKTISEAEEAESNVKGGKYV